MCVANAVTLSTVTETIGGLSNDGSAAVRANTPARRQGSSAAHRQPGSSGRRDAAPWCVDAP